MNNETVSSTECTTNAHDLTEAARLQAELSSQKSEPSAPLAGEVNSDDIPSVSIDEGAHKYVLVRASAPGSSETPSRVRTFVYSKQGASYHRNVAEYLLPILQNAGYYDIRITGGMSTFDSLCFESTNTIMIGLSHLLFFAIKVVE
jgi:hypothetical protein